MLNNGLPALDVKKRVLTNHREQIRSDGRIGTHPLLGLNSIKKFDPELIFRMTPLTPPLPPRSGLRSDEIGKYRQARFIHNTRTTHIVCTEQIGR